MSAGHESASAAGLTVVDANEGVTLQATLPLTLPPPSVGSSFPGLGQYPPPGPAPPYAERDPGAVNSGSMTPPPPYAESKLGFTIGDSKTLIDYTSLRDHRPRNTRATEEPSSLKLCDTHVVDFLARYLLGPVLKPIPMCCTTTGTQVSKDLNFQVSGKFASRWRLTGKPIPVGINFSSFKRSQRATVRNCLIRVLDSFNAHNVGPQFQYVGDASKSAFFISFRGDHPDCYASSFFPSDHPKDWYIVVYRLGLTLDKEQKRHLRDTAGEHDNIKDMKQKALEQNITQILAHELLHIVGVRHCDVNPQDEKEPYVRFPRGQSDEDNFDPLMRTKLPWRDFSQLDWKPETLEEIRQLYAMKAGEKIGPYTIRDVSWEDGAKRRKKIAINNARYSVPKRRKANRN